MWTRRFGGAGADRLTAVTVLPDRSIVAVGVSDSSSCRGFGGATDGWLVVLSADGTTRSERCLGGREDDSIADVAWAGSSVWVTGRTDSDDFPSTVDGPGTLPYYHQQAFVARITPRTGDIEVATLVGANATPRDDIISGHAIDVAPDGRVFVAGGATGLSQIRPTEGAFDLVGANTDIYVVGLR